MYVETHVIRLTSQSDEYGLIKKDIPDCAAREVAHLRSCGKTGS